MLHALVITGLAVVIIVSSIIGALVGSTMRFGRFGSSGFALISTTLSFAIALTVAITFAGTAIGWLFAALTAVIFGIMLRGAAN